MTLDARLAQLEVTPLVGVGWNTVAEALEEIRTELSEADPSTTLRVILLDAALRCASPGEDPSAFLSSAERWARGHDLGLGATELCLMWCTAVGRVDPGAIPEGIQAEAIAQAKSSGTLEAHWRLALATNHADEISLRTEALQHLQAPQHAHLHLQTLDDLAASHLHGGDTPKAIHYLEQALQWVEAFEAPAEVSRRSAMLGQLFLVQGMLQPARCHLERALRSSQDDLSTITAATLLCGLLLHAEEWELASSCAQQQIVAGRRRNNWMAICDATITISTSALSTQDPREAVRVLVQRHMEIAGLGPPAAAHLLEGRLAELSDQLGQHAFDPLFEEALAETAGA